MLSKAEQFYISEHVPGTIPENLAVELGKPIEEINEFIATLPKTNGFAVKQHGTSKIVSMTREGSEMSDDTHKEHGGTSGVFEKFGKSFKIRDNEPSQ